MGGGDPAFDFVMWTVHARAHASATDVLIDDYREAGGIAGGDFDDRRLVYEVADRLSALGHFTATGRPDLLALTVEDLRSALDSL